MPVALHVYIRDREDPARIEVEHVFYAATEALADKIKLAHLAGCENYARAEASDRTAELVEVISPDELPDAVEIFEDGGEDDDEEIEPGTDPDAEGEETP